MMILLTVIAFLVIFSVLVLIHECGHFFVALKSGIKVEEFGFGLPPKLWGVKKGEITYSINAIPFGGFVRLLGEDASDPKILKDKRSFASKPARVRLLVIVAGVTMNFILAVVLLTVGFIFGMKPLIISGDDVLSAISKGSIATVPGVLVKAVDAGSPAAGLGIMAGDRIFTLDGKDVMSGDQINGVLNSANAKPVMVTLVRNENKIDLSYKTAAGQNDGLNFYEVMALPRVAVKDVRPGSNSAAAGLAAGDVILSINDKPVYFLEQYNQEISTESSLNYLVLRDIKVISFKVDLPQKERVIISNVYPGSNAEKAGLMPGDLVLQINAQDIFAPADVSKVSKSYAGRKVQYAVRRGLETMTVDVDVAATGLIGIGLSAVTPYQNNDLSLYSLDVPTSVIRVDDVSYPFYIAPVKAVEESFRLGGLTIVMFIDVLKSIFTKFIVPAGVAGPVGIAQMTTQFVQEGFMSLLRFMALLSLSLAMINILPIPALDGGRLMFILIEVLIGRKIDPRFEAIVHTIGYVLLMIMIFAVTYSDIWRIIFK
jgi:regulator of sigma E protease